MRRVVAQADKSGRTNGPPRIRQGATPTPRDPEAWGRLSEAEQQAVFADYKAINETPGVTPGFGLDDPTTSTTVRVQDGAR